MRRHVLLALAAALCVLFACAAPPNGTNSSSPVTTRGGESPVWRTTPPSPPAPTAPTPQQLERSEPTSAARVITLKDPSHSEEVEVSEDQFGSFISWGCSDYLSDDKRIIVEIGRFEVAEFSDAAFILYDGSSSGDATMYRRKGVNQRWDWGENGEFAFVLKPDGTGLFYDFSNVPKGEETGANDMYKCVAR